MTETEEKIKKITSGIEKSVSDLKIICGELISENVDLKDVHDSDKKSLQLILSKFNDELLEKDKEIKKLLSVITEIDCYLCVKSTIREGELYDIHEILKKNGFKFINNNEWVIE